jgi:hypothetical protein
MAVRAIARFRPESRDDVPVRVQAYDPLVHGPGDRGIDQWRDEAKAWLDANPGRTVPAGNYLGVLRTALDLKMAELGTWDD